MSWVWDQRTSAWVQGSPKPNSAIAGGAAIVSPMPPVDLQQGTVWLDISIPTTPTLKVYSTVSGWVTASSTSGASTLTTLPLSTVAPAGATAGAMWIDISTAPPIMKFYDGTTWKPVSAPPTTTATIGSTAAAVAPLTPASGQLWLDTSLTPPKLKVFDGTNWIDSIIPNAEPISISAVAPLTPKTGDAWLDTSGTSPILKVYNGATWDLSLKNADSADITAGTSTIMFLTPKAWSDYKATITGDDADIKAGTDTDKFITPKAAKDYIDTLAAVAADIMAGTDKSKFVTPKSLADDSLSAPSAAKASAADSGKFVMLDSSGEIDSKFTATQMAKYLKLAGGKMTGAITLSAAPTTDLNPASKKYVDDKVTGALVYKGTADPTAAFGATLPTKGDMYISSSAGTIDASWTGAAGTISAGDMVFFDGTGFDVVSASGAAAMSGAIKTTTTSVDGNKITAKDPSHIPLILQIDAAQTADTLEVLSVKQSTRVGLRTTAVLTAVLQARLP